MRGPSNQLFRMSFNVTKAGVIVLARSYELNERHLAPLKHIKGDWRTYAFGGVHMSQALLDEISSAYGEALVRCNRAAWRWVAPEEQNLAYMVIEEDRRDTYKKLKRVERIIVRKLKEADAAITLQTAWRARRARGALVLLQGLRVIEHRLSCMRAAQTVQVAWGEYKLNKRVKALRRKHYLLLGVVRGRSARIIQRSWFAYVQELKREVAAFRRALGMCERGDCRNLGEEKNLSPDDAALIFARLVGM
jgi:hypothetical protein